MLTLGWLGIASPWMLLALLGLPALWWLLRVVPPPSRLERYSGIAWLLGLEQKEETTARMPLWLLILRMVMVTLVILALAHPIINPGNVLPGSGPVVLVVDDGWAAGRNWSDRQATLASLIDRAERESRDVVLLTTAPPRGGDAITVSGLMDAVAARRAVAALRPHAWPVDRAAAARAIADLDLEGSANVFWLSDGLADGTAGAEAAVAFAARLQRFGGLQMFSDPPERLPQTLAPLRDDPSGLSVTARRVAGATAQTATIRAAAADGRTLTQVEAAFDAGESEAAVHLDLPTEMRNRITRLEIVGQDTAGAVLLLDERWRRRPVGLVTSGAHESGRPFLGDHYYLQRALAPYSELRLGTLDALLRGDLAVLVLSDFGALAPAERTEVEQWIDGGGVLLRFAGPRFAEVEKPLAPVELRRGDRTFGGVMSWTTPARLAPFPAAGPFVGLVPPDDVLIQRQILAQPSLDLAERTWARLVDGTPLVTAEARGDGWLVLAHTTANADWSNLPLSGLFVEMLRRIVGISQGVAAELGDAVLSPVEVLDGLGRPAAPDETTEGIAAAALADVAIGPGHPPGFYGDEATRRALNLPDQIAAPQAIAGLPSGVTTTDYERSEEIDLRPWLLAAVLALLTLDTLVSLRMRGLLALRTAMGALALAVLLASPRPGAAQDDLDDTAMLGSLDTRLAYVVTGVPDIDNTSYAGLLGLSQVLIKRTSIEPAEPLGVDPEYDELSVFPFLYWPISEQARRPTEATLQKVNVYLRNGGLILFDGRDQPIGGAAALTGGGPRRELLGDILRRLNVPALEPVPPDHVLTKSFYLLQEFPGRWTGGNVWVEQRGSETNDGVSSVVIGNHDWAGAWAVNQTGRPISLPVPGGEQQREFAYRFGVNLIMYTLTGSYKADQVHVPAILERLGQ